MRWFCVTFRIKYYLMHFWRCVHSVSISFCQNFLFMFHSSEGGCKPHITPLLTAATQKHTYTPTDASSQTHCEDYDLHSSVIFILQRKSSQHLNTTFRATTEHGLKKTEEATALPWHHCGRHFGSNIESRSQCSYDILMKTYSSLTGNTVVDFIFYNFLFHHVCCLINRDFV